MIIAVSDFILAIISGFAVFAAVRYVAKSRNVFIEASNIARPSLLFGLFPVVGFNA